MDIHVKQLLGMLVFVTLSYLSSKGNAEEYTPNPTLLAELEDSLPKHWKLILDQSENTITIQSDRIMVVDGDINGSPSKHEGFYTLKLVAGERLKLTEHSKRQLAHESLESTIKSKRDLVKLNHQPWRPDLFDDNLAYEVISPLHIPVSATDRKYAESLYQLIRKHCAAHPASPHSDPSYYNNYLSKDRSSF